MQMRFIQLAIVLIGPSVVSSQVARAVDYWQQGPFKVGVRTEVFIDDARECAITHQPRTLVTEIWYPTVDEPTTPKNTFADFWLNEMGVGAGRFAMSRFGGDFDKINESFKTVAYRDAAIREGKSPLLIFSHGNGGFRHQNTYQAEYLASHGYVVAAADHTGNAAVTILPDRMMIYTKLTREPERRDDRPHDVSFLISHLTKLSESADHWLSGRLTPDAIGMFGHSFGGFTTCRTTELDDRIKAAMPMTLASSLWTEEGEDQSEPCPIPLMVILGDADRTVKEKGNRVSTAYFEKATGPKYLLNFKDAGHFTFTEMTQINPNFGDGIGVEKDKDGNVTLEFSDPLEDQRITNAYSAAFFDAYTKGDVEALGFLDENHTPEEMDFRQN
ncbi:MAG: hypothetical protein KDA93_01370 [Planctomycetaceae bacterium]|nr:hypothetical protein [Planctomycetaceae bacterium]